MFRSISRINSSLFCTACRSSNNVSVFNAASVQKSVFPVSAPPAAISGLIVAARDLHRSSFNRGLFTPKDDVSLWGRTLKKMGFTDIPKSILKASGYLMYMKVADEVDYMKFFNQCNLPDVYASWFTVVELHVWLLAARLMQNDKEGRIVRNSLIKAMWEDNELKSKKLEGALPSARKKELQGLNEQFHAAIIAYDEGLLGDDYILAGALWRRFLRHDSDLTTFKSQDFDSASDAEEIRKKVKALEMLVLYVRSQYYMLNNLSREQLIRKRAFKWAPFDDSLFELSVKAERASGTKAEAVKGR